MALLCFWNAAMRLFNLKSSTGRRTNNEWQPAIPGTWWATAFDFLYETIFSELPVNTTNDKGKKLERYYYLSINDCLNGNIDSEEAIRSIPSDRKLKSKFWSGYSAGHWIPRKNMPMRYFQSTSSLATMQFVWADGYRRYFGFNEEHMNKINLFWKCSESDWKIHINYR